MTADEFKNARESFDLTLVEFARVLGYNGPRESVLRTMLNYESGRRPIPGYIGSLIIMFQRFGIPTEFAIDAGLVMNDEDMEP